MAGTITFERLDEAIAWLENNDILTRDQIGRKIDPAMKSLLGDLDVFKASIQEQLRREIQESVSKGEGREEWAARMNGAGLSWVAQTETFGRTAMHRAYNAGTAELLNDDVVGELFPYLEYAATNDSRTRETHREMDGKVAHKNSPLAARMRMLADEFSCRCSLIPLMREDSLEKGIDDDTGWVEEDDQLATETADGKALEFEPHPMDEQAATFKVSSAMLDRLWQESPTTYLPASAVGPTEVAGRRERFTEFLGQGKKIEAPLVTVDDTGRMAFTDGRHRTAVLRDMGVAEIPVTVRLEDLMKFRKLLEKAELELREAMQTGGKLKRELIDQYLRDKPDLRALFESTDDNKQALIAEVIRDNPKLRGLYEAVSGKRALIDDVTKGNPKFKGLGY